MGWRGVRWRCGMERCEVERFGVERCEVEVWGGEV